MAKKKTKLDKMSKKERTSLAYALATNLAKHGKPQSPTNERKLTKGEENKKEKYMGKFKKAFSLEEINKIKEELKNPKKADLNKDGKLSSYEKTRGAAIEKAIQKEGELEEGLLSKLAGGVAILATLIAVGKINSSDSVIQDLKAKYEQADTQAEKDSLKNEIEARLIFLDTGVERVNEDLDIGHQDNEPRMLKKDLYRIAKYAAELYKMLDKFDVEGQEVDFPQWWQAKIITSKEAMVKAKHYLDGELAVPQIDATLEEEMGINDPILMKLRADKMRREKEANMPKPMASKMKKNNSAKIALLQKERERLMRDMEQEAELEGGPIADRYGDELNRIDKAIEKLRK